MRKLCFILSAVTFVLLIVHWSPWNHFMDGGRPLLEAWTTSAKLLGPNGTHFFEIERPFWGAILAGLSLTFLLEGLTRKRPFVVDDYADVEADLETY